MRIFFFSKILMSIPLPLENCIFNNKFASGFLHPLFPEVYIFASDYHNHNTNFASNGLLKIPTNISI